MGNSSTKSSRFSHLAIVDIRTISEDGEVEVWATHDLPDSFHCSHGHGF
jgi:hypothetical protein